MRTRADVGPGIEFLRKRTLTLVRGSGPVKWGEAEVGSAARRGTEAVDREVANPILEELRASGAALHLIHVVGAELGMVLVEGPTRSGGSVRSAASTGGFSSAAAAVAETLAHQYKLTYFSPSGVRSAPELQVTTTRAKVKIVAPTRISDDF